MTIADLSPALLAIAPRRFPRASCVVEDVLSFSPGDGTQDLVLMNYALTMIPGPRRALDVAWKALRPDGLLLLSDFTEDTVSQSLRA